MWVMKLEKIDANTLHIMLTKSDLDNRQVSMTDLMSSRKRIEKFFYSILEETGIAYRFSNNDQVTFQIMPTGHHGVEMFISKVADKSNLSLDKEGNMTFGFTNEKVKPKVASLLQGYDNTNFNRNKGSRNKNLTKRQGVSLAKKNQINRYNKNEGEYRYDGWYLLTSFDEFLTIAGFIKSKNLVSDLYEISVPYNSHLRNRNQNLRHAFLLHLFSNAKKSFIIELLMSDFGLKISSKQVEVSDLQKPIFTNFALELGKKYFKV